MKKMYTRRIFLVATMLILTACGGGGSDSGVEVTELTPEPQPLQRPYRAFLLKQEEKIETTFFEMTEEHFYEITVDYPSKINIKSKRTGLAWYHEEGVFSHLNDNKRGPDYVVFDENNNLIYKFGASYDRVKEHDIDIGTLQPGIYYLVVSHPLQYPSNNKPLDTLSDPHYYDLFVTHRNIAEDIYGTEEIDVLRGDDLDQTIYGYLGNDKIYGEAGNDIIDGGEGNDLIQGGLGADELAGGEGQDEIYGEAGNDIIDGGEGNDLIQGGLGADELTGGEGQDIFLYTSFEDSTFNLTERDIIRDFSITEDFVDISNLPEWSENYKFRQSNYFNNSEPNVAGLATLWFINGSLYGKRDYYDPLNPSFDFKIELEGVTSLPAERIIFP